MHRVQSDPPQSANGSVVEGPPNFPSATEHLTGWPSHGRGGPEGTAPFRFTRQVAVYDPLLIVAMAASAARRDLDLNQVRREEHALDSGRRVRIPLDDEVLVDVGVHRDLGKLVRLR